MNDRPGWPGQEEFALFSWPQEEQRPERRSFDLTSLVAERRRLYDVLDTFPDMVCVLDPDYNVVFSNRAFRARFGESDGRHCHEFVFGLAEPCPFCRAYEVLETGEAQHWEEPQTEDGSVVAVHNYPFADIDGSPRILVIKSDITEQRRTERELEAHREHLEELVRDRTAALAAAGERLRSLFDNSPDAIFVTHTAGGILDANPAAEAMFGWTAEEFRALERSALLDAGDPRLAEALEERERTRLVTGKELTAIRKNGERFTVEIDSVILGDEGNEAFVMMRDVTDRRRAERESVITSRALDQAAIGVMRVDSEGRIAVASESTCSLLGYRREELLSMPIYDLVEELTLEGWPARWAAFKQAGSEVFDREFRAKSGELVPVRVWLTTVEVDGREYANNFIQDIRDERASRKAIAERDEQLRQSQKMEAIGQLAGGIAHDFNNLLTTIIGNSSLLIGQFNADDPNRELVTSIKQVADRAAALTRQILAFSRRQVLRPETVSVNAIVAEVEPLLRGSLGEQVELQFLLAADPAMVEIDPGQLQQVVVNLAVNARDAMPEGGRLCIETENSCLGDPYCQAHPEVAPGAYVRLTVSDTGSGMDAETLSHIFEPFFTTKEVGKGTGLGLATVFGVIKQSGGSISVNSEPGRGTAFKIYLPVAASAAAAITAIPSQDRDLRGQETILVVEDEQSVRQLIVRVLSRAGYTVLEAGSAAEAQQILDEGTKPDLVLSDMVLPGGVTGSTFAEALHRERPEVKVIFMSGYTRETVADPDRVGEWARFIEKPFAPSRLLEEIQAALDSQPA
jgi:two-component system, cell cycle sensor histidine kinase and response regulator CckA